jgi:hypothetical protein
MFSFRAFAIDRLHDQETKHVYGSGKMGFWLTDNSTDFTTQWLHRRNTYGSPTRAPKMHGYRAWESAETLFVQE